MANYVVIFALQLFRLITGNTTKVFVGVQDPALSIGGGDQIMLPGKLAFTACGMGGRIHILIPLESVMPSLAILSLVSEMVLISTSYVIFTG